MKRIYVTVFVNQPKETRSSTKFIDKGSLKQQKLNVFFKRNDQKAAEVKRKRQDSEEREEEIEQPTCSSESAERAPTPTEQSDSPSETTDHEVAVSSDQEDTKSKTSPKPSEINKTKCNQIIKKLFLVNMPDDFYDFWEFCKSLSPESPQGMITVFLAEMCFIHLTLFKLCLQML